MVRFQARLTAELVAAVDEEVKRMKLSTRAAFVEHAVARELDRRAVERGEIYVGQRELAAYEADEETRRRADAAREVRADRARRRASIGDVVSCPRCEQPCPVVARVVGGKGAGALRYRHHPDANGDTCDGKSRVAYGWKPPRASADSEPSRLHVRSPGAGKGVPRSVPRGRSRRGRAAKSAVPVG